MEEPERLPQMLSPCSSGKRVNKYSNSPEFEFWMIRNPSFPQLNLHTADELFSDGVLLPLQLLQPQFSVEQSVSQPLPPPQEPEPLGLDQVQEIQIASTAELTDLSSTTPFTSLKRWKDIFKKSDKKNAVSVSNGNSNRSSKEKKSEKKSVGGGGGSNGVNAAELNINIWPFLRSRSAGNGRSRPRTRAGSAASTRKVSSAPCSRSNSAGESKSRKWPSSPNRGGVHLGRSSPVWQVRRCGGRRSSEAVAKSFTEEGLKKGENDGRRKISTASSAGGDVGRAKGRVLYPNVPISIGYRHNLGGRSDENSTIGATAAAAAGGGVTGRGVSGEGLRGSNLFNIRSLFTKKVY
ncbi:Hypothetical predicted protein [Olea europaea subsp. europaea]|uniref:Uncharacterized protein n=1 Tax=Olea europaea subsp. europaea TaxID=158383 RepID=A0A8S0TGQ5_OLEEU|nr:Hypothetical predicted protein [Olea europaea subsp. europaea]